MSRISIAAATAALLAAAFALVAACGSDNKSTPDAGTPDAGTGTSTAASCASYCSIIVPACTGANQQFDGAGDAATQTAACQTACTAQYKWVQTDDNKSAGSSGDDIDCRTQHATLAAQATTAADKTLHCGHAGPTGNKLCGTECDVYCDLQIKNCTTQNPNFPAGQTPNFPDKATCESQCQAVNGGTGFTFDTTKPRAISSSDPTLATNSGDTFQCRVWHVGEAAAGPNPHCFHSRITSVLPDGTTPGPCKP